VSLAQFTTEQKHGVLQFACASEAAADLSSAVLSLFCAWHDGGNPSSEWKWKQVEAHGPWVGLLYSGPSIATGSRASRSIQRGLRQPNGLAPSMDLLPTGSLWPNGYLAVTASFVWESAFTGLHMMFLLTWTLYALL
jgi:hypothetical protein